MGPHEKGEIVWDWSLKFLTPERIEDGTNNLITKVKEAYDALGKIPVKDSGFSNVIVVLAELEREFLTESKIYNFPQNVSVDKDIREASSKAEKVLDEFEVEINMRKDIFERVVAFHQKEEYNSLQPEWKRYVDRLLQMGKRNGLHLEDHICARVTNIKKRIADLSVEFQRNLNEEVTTLYFSADQLAGMRDDFLCGLEKNDQGLYRVTLKYPDYFPVTRNCEVPETRKALETAFHSRCLTTNTPILETLVRLRHEHALLLGYPSHAAFQQEIRMAKTPEAVHKFLKELASSLQPLWEKDLLLMKNMKEEECKKLGLPFSKELDLWDIRYYMTKIEKNLYDIDQEELKNYFPIDVVTDGMLCVYQEVLGLRFVEVKDMDKWHPDVRTYRVIEASTGVNMGYFYLDLFPREGKFDHAAVYTLQSGCLRKDGHRQLAVAAMLANFTKPCPDKPSLLDHKEVETYFHEFGHVMHQVCSKTTLCHFSGTKVEGDFVEAPSQMLENWVWEPEILYKMSKHIKTHEHLPRELILKLVMSRKANPGALNLRQVVLATFDQKIHTMCNADTQKVFAETYKELMDVTVIPSTNMPASFGHMGGGYDALYYGYLWSEVYSMDMFESQFKQRGIMNKDVWQKYKHCILEPGGSKDAIDMLRDFLGREPSSEAFLCSKGIQVADKTQ